MSELVLTVLTTVCCPCDGFLRPPKYGYALCSWYQARSGGSELRSAARCGRCGRVWGERSLRPFVV